MNDKHDKRLPIEKLGGRADLARVFHAAKELIIRHKVLRICHKEIEGVIHRLTICNLWRIEREADQPLRFAELDLRTGEWCTVTDITLWPVIPVWPIHRAQDPEYARAVLRKAIWRALDAAGLKELPRLPPGGVPFDFTADGYIASTKGHRAKQPVRFMSPNRMGNLLEAHYLGRSFRGQFKPGFITNESIHAGGRALRAAFHEHIRDKALFGIAIAVDYTDVPFTFYLQMEQHREAVLRIARENRNLLPLLLRILPEQWERTDLFSRNLWVRGERKSTLIDRPGFEKKALATLPRRLRSFAAAKNWRWLHRAAAPVVRAWNNAGCDQRILSALAEAHISQRVPVVVLRALIYETRFLRQDDDTTHLANVFRLHLIHAAKLWKDEGHAAVARWVRGINIQSLWDYLTHEGFAHGFPQKNSTVHSLVERSREWHERIRIAAMQREEAEQRAQFWDSALPETVIDGITFTPLTTAYALAVEGHEQHHCVASYARACLEGRARIFAVRDANGNRSTLELNTAGRTVKVWQHRASHNGAVQSKAISQAATKIAKHYQRARKALAGDSASQTIKGD